MCEKCNCPQCKGGNTLLLPQYETLLNDLEYQENQEYQEFPEMSWEAPVPLPPPPPANRMVNPAKVSCLSSPYRDAILRRIGTNDPAGVLERAVQRAVALLTRAIDDMTEAKRRITAGATPAAAMAAINPVMAWSLRTRMLMHVDERVAWTGTGRRNAGLIIRWLSNIRKIFASGQMNFTCLWNGMGGTDCFLPAGTPCCTNGIWAWSSADRMRIDLCLQFWQPGGGDPATDLDFQAQTLIHEGSHIYYNTEDSGMGPGHAECISQFVADMSNSPIDINFIGVCGGARP